jgi:hypothetical protein
MKSTTCTALGVATAFALALAALPARADWDRDHDRHVPPPPVAQPAPPAHFVAPAPAFAPPAYRPVRWGRGWQMNELRREYARLDAQRDRFYATWNGAPWSRDRFESWYAARRAELDHRWYEIERHGRWND